MNDGHVPKDSIVVRSGWPDCDREFDGNDQGRRLGDRLRPVEEKRLQSR